LASMNSQKRDFIPQADFTWPHRAPPQLVSKGWRDQAIEHRSINLAHRWSPPVKPNRSGRGGVLDGTHPWLDLRATGAWPEEPGSEI